MLPDKLIMRGYVDKDGDSYFCICLDINIYARGDSPKEALDRCLAAVVDYVNEAIGVDKDHAADLVPRRAPLHFWLRYGYLRLRDLIISFFDRDHDDRKPNGGPFKHPLPLRVAC